MTKSWLPGETVALRGIYNQRVWYMQSPLVVQDDADEVVLLLMPGAECAATEEYIHGKHGASGRYDRWGNYQREHRNMQNYLWHTNRLLILLEPEKYYSTMLFWEQSSDSFLGYYVNFQLPFRRGPLGFDNLDLELDLFVVPTFEWTWKDVETYRQGIDSGIIRQEWADGIEAAKEEIFTNIENRSYPFDGSWLDWRPDPAWQPPKLIQNWDKI